MSAAWTTDWKERAKRAIEARGYASMIEFARANETATFYEIAEELGGQSLAPVQIESLLRDDSERLGCFDYFVRSALVRQLYHYVPKGIRAHGEWKLIRALSSWVGMVGATPELERACSTTADAIQHDGNLPADWLPESSDDPRFKGFFGDDESK
jgi:hypothetical protein